MPNYQRPLNSVKVGTLPAAPPRQTGLDETSPIHPRNSAAKRTQTELAPAAPGQPLSGPVQTRLKQGYSNPLDAPGTKPFLDGRSEPVHPGMQHVVSVADDKLRGSHDRQDGSRVLDEASRLGRKA